MRSSRQPTSDQERSRPLEGDEAPSNHRREAAPRAWLTRLLEGPETDRVGTGGERGSGGGFRELASRVPFQAALAAFAILLIVLFSWQSPFFLTVGNFRAILINISILGVFAVPLTMLLIAGHLDISITSNAALSGVVFAMVSGAGDASLLVGALAAMGVGLGIGAINGALVTKVGINAIIVTLGSLSLFRGLAKVLSNGQTVRMNHDIPLLGSELLGVPVPVLVLAAVALTLGVVMHFTIFGRRLRAIGSNPTASRLSGVHVNRNVFAMFLLAGGLSALAGLMFVAQLNAAAPTVADGFELTVATAVILGGASIRGGVGSISGAILAVFVLGLFNNGLIVSGVSPFWQEAAQGGVLIAAVTFDQIRLRTGRIQ